MSMRWPGAALAAVFLMGAAAPDDDPYAWMEEIEGARALDWAKAENARSLPQLQNDPRYAGLYADALKIATAEDRIPNVGFAGKGVLRDFWQDGDHVRGLWRETTLESYRARAPQWRTLLDIDALAKAEGANWVFKGAGCLFPENRRCLVSLSDGGKDAVRVREFDTVTGSWVDGGFRLPEGKADVNWIDKDTLLVVDEWRKGDVTTSGYPFIAKLLRRGQTYAQAQQVFAGTKDDGGYGVSSHVYRKPDGQVAVAILQRPLDTFNSEFYLLMGDRPLRLDLPKKSTLRGYVSGRLVVSLEEDWPAKGFKEGDLVDFDLAAVNATPGDLRPSLVLRPTETQSVEQVGVTRDRLVVVLLDNVKGQVRCFRRAGGGWASTTLDLPKDSTLDLDSASDHDDRILVTASGFLSPSSQWLADAAAGKVEQLRSLPARFDASKYAVDQRWATSRDGTKVPYFVVHAKDLNRICPRPSPSPPPFPHGGPTVCAAR